ncbi:hypothetical protein PspLS_09667, partial [Pyricularia sp. CBS 133598]
KFTSFAFGQQNLSLLSGHQPKCHHCQQQHFLPATTARMSVSFWGAVGSAARFGMAAIVVATTLATFSGRVMDDEGEPLSLTMWTEEEGDAWWWIP